MPESYRFVVVSVERKKVVTTSAKNSGREHRTGLMLLIFLAFLAFSAAFLCDLRGQKLFWTFNMQKKLLTAKIAEERPQRTLRKSKP